MPKVLYSGPRDELRWNGLTFRRNRVTTVTSEKDARRLSALDGFVVLPKNKGGRPRKPDVENSR